MFGSLKGSGREGFEGGKYDENGEIF